MKAMRMNARTLALNGALIALYIVLKFLGFDFVMLKINFSPFPVLLSAMLLGPVSGFAVGALGEGIIQVIQYGLGPMTLLWILPAALRGLLAGLYAMRKGYALTLRETILCVLVTGMLVTALNTALLYVDGLVFGYPVAYTAYAIAMRFASSIVIITILSAILPKTIQLTRKAVNL